MERPKGRRYSAGVRCALPFRCLELGATRVEGVTARRGCRVASFGRGVAGEGAGGDDLAGRLGSRGAAGGAQDVGLGDGAGLRKQAARASSAVRWFCQVCGGAGGVSGVGAWEALRGRDPAGGRHVGGFFVGAAGTDNTPVVGGSWLCRVGERGRDAGLMFDWIEAELDCLGAQGLLREPRDGLVREAVRDGATARGDAFIDASSNDYLGYGREALSSNWGAREENGCGLSGGSVSRETNRERPTEACPSAGETAMKPNSGVVADHPKLDDTVGACASRLLGGTRSAHTVLETAIADWLGQERALLFSSGYAANVGLISSLAGPSDVIFSDALNHASIIDGCRLSRASAVTFPHRDENALAELLSSATQARRRFLLTESYFSMDGDSPDLARLRALADKFNAILIVDEAHALGVFGPKGAGLSAQSGVRPDIVVGTLGKAIGLQGAFVAGPEPIQRWLWNRARSFVYSTAPVPVLARMALLHVKRIQNDDAGRQILVDRAKALRNSISDLGFPMPPGSHGPIVPVLLFENDAAISAADRLRSLGVLAYPLRPPTVPAGTARLRLTVSADISDAEFSRLQATVRYALQPFAPKAKSGAAGGSRCV